MATITINLSAAAQAELVDAICAWFGYQATLPNGTANPETRGEFARRMVIQWMKERVLQYRRRVAAEAAAATDPDIT